MRRFGRSPFAALGDTIERLADHAEAGLRSRSGSLETAIESLRDSLESSVGGYRHAAIGVTGLFDSDRCRSITTILAQSIVESRGLTTTIARISRCGRQHGTRASFESVAWQQPLRPRSLNLWPGLHMPEAVRADVDDRELLHWLRCSSELSLLTFDSIGDVLTHLPLARRLDGLVIVNSGEPADLDLMASAAEMLQRRGVRLLGQVRDRREAQDRAGAARTGAS